MNLEEKDIQEDMEVTGQNNLISKFWRGLQGTRKGEKDEMSGPG
jgi:hypothetical protein